MTSDNNEVVLEVGEDSIYEILGFGAANVGGNIRMSLGTKKGIAAFSIEGPRVWAIIQRLIVAGSKACGITDNELRKTYTLYDKMQNSLHHGSFEKDIIDCNNAADAIAKAEKSFAIDYAKLVS